MTLEFKEVIEKSLFCPSKEERPYDKNLFERVFKHDIDSLVLLGDGGNKAVVFFHGNDGNVTHYVDKMKRIQKKNPNADIWCFDYPGFGRSINHPNAETLVNKSYEFLCMIQKQYDNWEWIGETIGACVMIGVLYSLSDDRQLKYLPTKLTLINAMTSIGHIANDRHPGFNTKMIVKKCGFELHTAKWINVCKERFGDDMPEIVIMRSKLDTEIPMKHTETLSEVSGSPIVYIEGTHRDYLY